MALCLVLVRVSLVFSSESAACLVIDAGHGGSNHGASVHGSKLSEKHLSLVLARYIVSELQVNVPNTCVIPTRKADRYVSLRQRSLFALKHNAALFISVHFNASKLHDQSGYEIYVPDGAAISDLANRRGISLPVIDSSDVHADDYQIIHQAIDPLIRASVAARSKELAVRIHKALARTMEKLPSRGIKKGDFDVLHSLGIPRVLVEIGFVDTPQGAEQFSDKKKLLDIAREIARAVGAFYQATQ